MSEPTEVIVVGAGLSGLCAGIKLQAAGIDDFVLLERAADVGGCWRDNTYPGIGVDVSTFSYSFSFAQNPNWSRSFARGAEVKAYADHLAEKYGLRRKIRFGCDVTKARFDQQEHMWRLQLSDGETLSGRFLICGTGVLSDPKLPDIPGVEAFAGKTVHTARWDHDHDLTGERVAVIGTGATAVQLLPRIARKVEQLHVFQRTPIWVLPKPDFPIPGVVKQLFRSVPPTQTAARAVSGAGTELLMTAARNNRQMPFLTKGVEALGRGFLRFQVRDPETRRKLLPHYGFGCKRPALANDYLTTFNRANVELVTDPIERITTAGIVTSDGRERELDTLILATGFQVLDKRNLPGFETYGVGGLELADFWYEHRFQAYEGVTVPRFPNFFLLFGPYALASLSFLSTTEANTRHAVRCISEARRRGATAVEVRQEPHDRYFEQVLLKMKDTVFLNNGCATANSYYFDHRGDAPVMRPTPALAATWRSGHFDLDDYAYWTAAA
jgi:cation diffusion facilitator CzcD-associated flavoprotein CzcO